MSDQTQALVKASSAPTLAERLLTTAALAAQWAALWPDRGSMSVSDMDHRELHESGLRQSAFASNDAGDWMLFVKVGQQFGAGAVSLYGEWEPSCEECQQLVEASRTLNLAVAAILNRDAEVQP